MPYLIEKAFDKVWHARLVYKLGLCGVQPIALAWSAAYLAHRSLRVQVESTLSQPRHITAGVPQGSQLGSILFSVFINYLPAAVPTSTSLYAEDALLCSECVLVDVNRQDEGKSAHLCL